MEWTTKTPTRPGLYVRALSTGLVQAFYIRRTDGYLTSIYGQVSGFASAYRYLGPLADPMPAGISPASANRRKARKQEP